MVTFTSLASPDLRLYLPTIRETVQFAGGSYSTDDPDIVERLEFSPHCVRSGGDGETRRDVPVVVAVDEDDTNGEVVVRDSGSPNGFSLAPAGAGESVPLGAFDLVLNFGDSAQAANPGWARPLAQRLYADYSSSAVGGAAISLSTNADGTRGFSQILQAITAADRDATGFPFLAAPPTERTLALFGSAFNDALLNGGASAIPRIVHAVRASLLRLFSSRVVGAADPPYLYVSAGVGETQWTGWSAQAGTDKNSGTGLFTADAAGALMEFWFSGLMLDEHQRPGFIAVAKHGATGLLDFYAREADDDPEEHGELIGTLDVTEFTPAMANKWGAGCFIYDRDSYDFTPSSQLRCIVREVSGPNVVGVDSVNVEASQLPYVVWRTVHTPSNEAAYWAADVPTRNADIVDINEALTPVFAEFEKPRQVPPTIVLDMDALLHADPAEFFPDGLHPDAGNRKLETQAYRDIAARIAAAAALNGDATS